MTENLRYCGIKGFIEIIIKANLRASFIPTKCAESTVCQVSPKHAFSRYEVDELLLLSSRPALLC